MEFMCWFLQEKLGKNRGKSSWGRMVSLSSNFPFYSSSRIWRVQAVQVCTPCTSLRCLFRVLKQRERRAVVHAVLLPIFMILRRQKEGTACIAARRAVVLTPCSWIIWWTARRAALHGVQSLCCAISNLDLLSRTPNALHTTPLASWSDHLSP